MKKITLFFINLLLVSSMAFANSDGATIPTRKNETPTTKSSSSSLVYPVTYSYSSVPFAPLSTAGTSITLSDDIVSGVLPIGFNFDFYGITYSDFYISSNGFITFNAGTENGCCTGLLLPDATDDVNNIIAAAWEDLYPPGGGSITYATVGTSPNRKLVVSYTNIPHFSDGNPVTTQIILSETTNVIEIHTTSMPSDGGLHTQGIENADGTVALTTPGRNSTNWSAINDAVRFDPSGSSLNFDGFDDGIDVNQTLGNFGTSDFTVELQVKTAQDNAYLFFKRGICNVDNFISMDINAGKIRFEAYDADIAGSNATIVGNIVVNNNTWRKIAVTRIAGTFRIYVDGVLDATLAPTNPQNASIDLSSTYTLKFGGALPCFGPGSPLIFNGNMDEVRFWNRGLLQCEIQNNLNCELASGQTNLLAYYKFNQGNPANANATVTTLVDETGNGNNGTLNNFALSGTTSNWDIAAGVPSGFTCNNVTVSQYYVDADADGFGSAILPSIPACTQPVGYVLNNTDCNDTAATVFPGATEICYDGLDNDCDGTIDEGCTPIVTVVQTSQCGVTLTSIDQDVVANSVSNVQGYRFRVTNLATSQVQTIDKLLRVFKITQLPTYAFNTTYQVEVAVRFNNIWQPFYGAPCTVTTPATSSFVQASQCGSTLTTMDQPIYANIVPFAAGYRFRITNQLTSQSQTIDRVLREFRMTLLTNPIINYGTSYTVEVAVKNTDGSYLVYGTPCTINTPSFPTTKLQISQCNYVATSLTENIFANAFSGATAYKFIVTGPNGYSAQVNKSLRSFSLSNLPTLQTGTAYSVGVQLQINGVFGPTGDLCTVTTPGTALTSITLRTDVQVSKTTPLSVIAYPNPFAADFKLNIRTSSEGTLQVMVYDMLGKIVENRNIKSTEIENLEIGSNYPAGVYNVIVTQDENVETVRVIKR